MRTVASLAEWRLANLPAFRRSRRFPGCFGGFSRQLAQACQKHARVLRAVVALWVLGCFLFPGGNRAETQAGTASPSNRYLLIVETSRNMQSRAPAAVTAIRELLAGPLAAQMRPGDSVGIWTFDEALHAGEFPLQRWTSEGAKAVAEKITLFIQGKSFDKAAALEKVVPAVNGVAAKSEFITVVLVSSGEEALRGTPFDAAINQTFASWQERQRKARMPFVTVLRAKRGRFTDFAVTPLPWPVELPPFPAELLARRQTEPKSTMTSSNRGPAPVIISGSKSTNEAGVAPKRPRPAAVTISTQAVAQALAEETSPSTPVSASTPEPVPVKTEPAAQPDVSSVVPAPVPVAEVPKRVTPPSSVPMTSTVALTATPPVAATAQSVASQPETPKAAVPQSAVSKTQVPSVRPQPQVTAAAAPQPWLKRKTTRLVFLGVAAFAFGGLLLLFFRKPRVEPRGSLITRSLEKDQK